MKRFKELSKASLNSPINIFATDATCISSQMEAEELKCNISPSLRIPIPSCAQLSAAGRSAENLPGRCTGATLASAARVLLVTGFLFSQKPILAPQEPCLARFAQSTPCQLSSFFLKNLLRRRKKRRGGGLWWWFKHRNKI